MALSTVGPAWPCSSGPWEATGALTVNMAYLTPMPSTFPSTPTYLPDFDGQGTSRSNTTNLTTTDGYELRISRGFKPKLRVWNLTWMNRFKAQATLIYNWLYARQAMESFYWTPPSEPRGLWICTRLERVNSEAAVNTITATFREVQL